MAAEAEMRKKLPDKYYNEEIKCGAHKGKAFAVFTSGGDSQGMNAAVRAVVRTAIYLGCEVYFVHEGYQGMVEGGDYIQRANWSSVSNILHRGGTVIGSARCQAFRERAGRLSAAKNLVQRHITNLVPIGGDGTLTGAALFKNEWRDLLEELRKSGDITEEEWGAHQTLHIAGLVGSIDNDFCGTDMTIGTDSALHRIIDATDAIVSTAYSHQRTFIMEVMGRHCGYLALVAAICTEADYLFIPEEPVPTNWRENLCDKLSQERKAGQRLNIIIVSEGAMDRHGTPITAEDVRKVIVDRLNQDTRITVLGHVQRGGFPSAFDRIIAARMGAAAVLALVSFNDKSEPVVITVNGNKIMRKPLMECVNDTQAVTRAMSAKEWERAVELRGKSFKRNLEAFKMLTRLHARPSITGVQQRYTLAVTCIGAPACGVNAAVRSFVRNALQRGDTRVLGIHDGIRGLIAGKMSEMDWSSVTGWVATGGAQLGTNRTLPGHHMAEVSARLSAAKVDGLLIIGGFEAYRTVLQMSEARAKYDALKIPIVIVPSTISNNVPGTDFSLGCDSALNEIIKICDQVRQSAEGTTRRVFVVETMGGYCGYLATLAGLGGGADAAYIFEEQFGISDLQRDVTHLSKKMTEGGVQRGLLLRNENASENYSTDFLYRLFSEEGKDLFSTRMNILGHMQQGGSPSPFDRNLGTKMGSKAVEWLMSKLLDANRDPSQPEATMMGIIGKDYHFTPLLELKDEADFEHRMPKEQWWLRLRQLLRVLSQHESTYE